MITKDSYQILPIRHILHSLNFHPYKIATVQKLQSQYFVRRRFADIMREMLEQEHGIVILTSDEVHFHLKGGLIKQNCRYWSRHNPQQWPPLHCDKLKVYAELGKVCVIGPYFIEENTRGFMK